MTKELTHEQLCTFVYTFAPMVERGGICNGFTAMWLQAVLTSKKDLAVFYQRLDEISFELKQNTLAQLKEEIDSILMLKTDLIEETLKKTELRAFAEAVAIQQDPSRVLNNHNLSPEKKEVLYPLTASKKTEEQHIKFNINPIGSLMPTLSELELYLEKMQTELKIQAPNETIGFMINSTDHTTGVYLDPDSGKFHFLDINTFGRYATYHLEVNAKELAPLIFDSFSTKKESYGPIRILAVSTTDNTTLISALKNMAQTSLLTNRSFLRHTPNNQHTLGLACEEGDIETVALLLKEPDIENMLNSSYEKEGNTPLFLACEGGHTEIVKLLLATKNNEMIKSIEKPNFEKQTALSVSKKYDHTEIEALLKSVIPPWRHQTVRFTVNPAKRKAEDDLNKRPAKKPNNAVDKMVEEPSSFPYTIM